MGCRYCCGRNRVSSQNSKDLEHQAKARLIADKKEARREKFDKLIANIKEKFSKKINRLKRLT